MFGVHRKDNQLFYLSTKRNLFEIEEHLPSYLIQTEMRHINCLFDSLRQGQHFFRNAGMGLPGLNQY